jgi:hypothetical protein
MKQRQHPARFTEDEIYYNAITHPEAQDLGASKSVNICNLGKTLHVDMFSFLLPASNHISLPEFPFALLLLLL